jgi:carbon monoxide dehydrogenase subunit G
MPSASVTFEVKSPPETVFGFSNDLPRLGSLIPDVTQVDVVDDTTAVWTLVAKIGFVKRTIKMRTTITEMDPPSYASFLGTSDEMDLAGSVDLTPLPASGTSVACALDAQARDPSGRSSTAFSPIGSPRKRAGSRRTSSGCWRRGRANRPLPASLGGGSCPPASPPRGRGS